MSAVKPVASVHEHTSCEIIVTNSCNMACGYCIARDLPGPPMTVEIGRKAIDMFIYLAEGGKTIEFTFTGGEPLTEFGALKELTRYAIKHAHMAGMKACFVLKTNGSILDQDIIDFIKLNSIKVIVSIDGTPSAHDKHRMTAHGRATHAVVQNNLQILRKNRISCLASITVHPDLAHLLLENVRYLNELGLKEMDVGPAYGTVTWADSECLDLSRSLMNVADLIRDLNSEGHRIGVGPLRQESEHVGGILANCWGCHAASRNLAFLPNGQVTGCSALAMLVCKHPKLVLGDVFNGLNQPSVDNLVGLAKTRGEDRPICRNCETAANCTGGCLAINYSTTGLALIPPDIYCKTISTIPQAWGKAWG
jgi:uncharacterized protein